jgi:hypothetical protein
MSVLECTQCDQCKRIESRHPTNWYALNRDVSSWDFCKAECLFWWMHERQEKDKL